MMICWGGEFVVEITRIVGRKREERVYVVVENGGWREVLDRILST